MKNYKSMSREDLLIALLKSKQSIAELRNSKDNNAEIEETKQIFNELRNNFSKKEIKKIKENFRFRELEKKGSLAEQEKREKKRYTGKLKEDEEYLKKLKEEDLNRLERYKYNDNDDLDYKGIRQIENLFEEINEDYYKPIKTKSTFNNDYMEYESKGDKDKNLSINDYFNIIKPFLRDMISNHKTHGEWEIQLIMQINFISSLDTEEFRIMHSKSNNVKIMSGIETDDIINKLFKSFLNEYQSGLEKKNERNSFCFWKRWFIIL